MTCYSWTTSHGYEPFRVFTLIWWPQCCKNCSLMIWIWWYPKPRLKRFVMIPALRRCKLFVMVVCHFQGKKGFVLRNVGKMLIFALLKLHCPNSESKFFHNIWCNDWMSVCLEIIGQSSLQWLWPKKKLISCFWHYGSVCLK